MGVFKRTWKIVSGAAVSGVLMLALTGQALAASNINVTLTPADDGKTFEESVSASGDEDVKANLTVTNDTGVSIRNFNRKEDYQVRWGGTSSSSGTYPVLNSQDVAGKTRSPGESFSFELSFDKNTNIALFGFCDDDWNKPINDSYAAKVVLRINRPTASAGQSEEGPVDDGPSPEERAEQARQEQLEREYNELIEKATAPENRTVQGITSDLDGYYLARKVDGVAFGSAPNDATTEESSSFIKVMDTDTKKSTEAVAVAEFIAASRGGVVGPCIDVIYGKMENGIYTRSVEGTAREMSLGIPAAFQVPGARYAVVAIYAGGNFKVFENTSDIPGILTVSLEEALSPDVMYSVIRY